jgi:DNA gyrase subunit B
MIAHQKFLHMVERRGHPREIVEALVAAGADREYFADRDKLDSLSRALTSPTRTVTVRRDEEHNRYQLHVDDRSNGYPRQHTIGVDFVTAVDYRTLLANRRDIPELTGEIVVSGAEIPEVSDGVAEADGEPSAEAPAASGPSPAASGQAAAASGQEPVASGQEPVASGQAPVASGFSRTKKAADVRLHSLDELVDYFLTAGKKGIAINRYKGLGEMNPDQLWETTMNPAVRTLLQVRAEDHTEADLMFTTLMGDQVEPRRKFIEDNALDVKNLDV